MYVRMTAWAARVCMYGVYEYLLVIVCVQVDMLIRKAGAHVNAVDPHDAQDALRKAICYQQCALIPILIKNGAGMRTVTQIYVCFMDTLMHIHRFECIHACAYTHMCVCIDVSMCVSSVEVCFFPQYYGVLKSKHLTNDTCETYRV
jgi:hypothetical protein